MIYRAPTLRGQGLKTRIVHVLWQSLLVNRSNEREVSSDLCCLQILYQFKWQRPIRMELVVKKEYFHFGSIRGLAKFSAGSCVLKNWIIDALSMDNRYLYTK